MGNHSSQHPRQTSSISIDKASSRRFAGLSTAIFAAALAVITQNLPARAAGFADTAEDLFPDASFFLGGIAVILSLMALTMVALALRQRGLPRRRQTQNVSS